MIPCVLELPGARIAEAHGWMDLSWTCFSVAPAWVFYLVFLVFLIPPILHKSKLGTVVFGGLFAVFVASRYSFGVPFVTNFSFFGYLLIVLGLGWTIFAFKNPRKVMRYPGPGSESLVKRVTGFAVVVLGLAMMAGFPRSVTVSAGAATACHSNMKNIAIAAQMYQTDWNNAYPRELGALVPNYLKELPACPVQGDGSSPYKLEATDSGYQVVCQGAKHKEHKEWTVEPVAVGR